MSATMTERRRFLRKAGLSALALSSAPLLEGCAGLAAHGTPPSASVFAAPPPLAPIRASSDRIIALDVCTRPFRPQGPRIEAERLGDRTVIHNYGHGGSGWSLSWGSAALALDLVRATGEREIAVVGCGAIGLTTALAAQRSGLKVRIYAREQLPRVPSYFATGVWSPDSRIAAAEHDTPQLRQRWETMARTSFRAYQALLGLPGDPVGWHDFYHLRDREPSGPPRGPGAGDEPDYVHFESRLIPDLGPDSVRLAAGTHPFKAASVRRGTQMVFNLAAYSRLLLDDFLALGGAIEQREFSDPGELARLREKTVVNATGYGARALLGDGALVPVRGQTARLIPQPEVDYGLSWGGHNLFVVPRPDGILVQTQEPGDYGNADIVPDRALSEAAVERLAELFA